MNPIVTSRSITFWIWDSSAPSCITTTIEMIPELSIVPQHAALTGRAFGEQQPAQNQQRRRTDGG